MDKQREPEAVGPVWESVRDCLEDKKRRIFEEIRNYPPPIAGCDLHFKQLLEERDAICWELRRLDAICRDGAVQDDSVIEAFIASSNYIEDDAKARLRKASGRSEEHTSELQSLM